MQLGVGHDLPIEAHAMKLTTRMLPSIATLVLALAGAGANAGPRPPEPTWLGRSVTFPCAITLVGLDSHGKPDPAGAFTISVTDIAGNPIQNSAIVLDFSGCTDIAICTAGGSPGVTVDCPNHRILATTDAYGLVTLIVAGGGSGHQPCSAVPCMRVLVDNILMSDGINHPVDVVSITDEDGTGGIGAADLSRLISDSFSATYCARSDFDHAVACVSSVGAADLSRWLTSYFKGYVYDCSSTSGHYCP
jgi:hypothetical protein